MLEAPALCNCEFVAQFQAGSDRPGRVACYCTTCKLLGWRTDRVSGMDRTKTAKKSCARTPTPPSLYSARLNPANPLIVFSPKRMASESV